VSLGQINPKFLPVADKFYLTLTCDRRGFAWTATTIYGALFAFWLCDS